jgi:hypothetical protein
MVYRFGKWSLLKRDVWSARKCAPAFISADLLMIGVMAGLSVAKSMKFLMTTACAKA